MSIKKYLMYFVISAPSFSCQFSLSPNHSNNLMGSISNKSLQVSVVDQGSKNKKISIIPYFPPKENSINTSVVYFKAVGFDEKNIYLDRNYYDFVEYKNPGSGNYTPKERHGGYSGYSIIEKNAYTSIPETKGWVLANNDKIKASGNVVYEKNVLDLRPPSVGMDMIIIVPIQGLMSIGIDIIKKMDSWIEGGADNGMRLKIKSHLVRKESNQDIVIAAKTNIIDDVLIRNIVGLPVYSSDQRKILGFVEVFKRGESKNGEMNIRILSIHSPRLQQVLSLWERYNASSIQEEFAVSQEWIGQFCNKRFVEKAVKERLQEHKKQTNCQPKVSNPKVSSAPQAPWDYLPGSGWCDSASVLSAIEKSVEADYNVQRAEACCGSTSKPKWITDSFEEDESRAKYCDPQFVREAIERVIAMESNCKEIPLKAK